MSGDKRKWWVVIASSEYFILLVILFIVGFFERGFMAAIRVVAGALIIGGTTWIVFHMLMRLFKHIDLHISFWIAVGVTSCASITLFFLNRGEYVVITMIPGIILGALAYLVTKK